MAWTGLAKGILEEFAAAIDGAARGRDRIYALDMWLSGADFSRSRARKPAATTSLASSRPRGGRPRAVLPHGYVLSATHRAALRAAQAIAMGWSPDSRDRKELTKLVARLSKADWYVRNRDTMLAEARARYASISREEADAINRDARTRRAAIVADPIRGPKFLIAERARAKRNGPRYRATPSGLAKKRAANRAYMARRRRAIHADPKKRETERARRAAEYARYKAKHAHLAKPNVAK